MDQPWRKIAVLLFLLLPVSSALGQQEPSPYAKLMAAAAVKRAIVVDTPAGQMGVLIVSIAAEPALVIVFAPGGEGNPGITIDGDGQPVVRQRRNAAFTFGLAFTARQAAWAVVDAPGGGELSRQTRTTQQHVDAFAQVARRVREEYPKARHILIGHSNGGITAGMQAVQPGRVFDGIVMSSPVLGWLPFRWNAEQAKVPLKFITHRQDECKGTPAYATIRAAGEKFPLTVIDKPALGDRFACRGGTGPHFFTGAIDEYADAVLKWAATLK